MKKVPSIHSDPYSHPFKKNAIKPEALDVMNIKKQSVAMEK
jgi:hypothetical protein